MTWQITIKSNKDRCCVLPISFLIMSEQSVSAKIENDYAHGAKSVEVPGEKQSAAPLVCPLYISLQEHPFNITLAQWKRCSTYQHSLDHRSTYSNKYERDWVANVKFTNST